MPASNLGGNRKVKIIIVAIALLVVLPFIFPLGRPSMKGVHPSLTNLQGPIRVTKAIFYLDGGSIGVEIVDGGDTTNFFAIPVSSAPNTDRYTHFALGSVRDAKSNPQRLIPLNSKTKAYIGYLLERKTPRDTDADIALASLRGAPRDYATLFIHVLHSRLKE